MAAFWTRLLRWRMAPLWLVLAAFLGHTAMPPAIWGSLNPRESERESDALEEVWKCAAGSQSRPLAQGRTQRRAGPVWGPPLDWTVSSRQRTAMHWGAGRLARGEWAERNGLGGPLRC